MKKNISIAHLKPIRDRADIRGLLDLMQAERICEVGVCEGSHFRSLMSAPYIKHGVAVDLWRETGVRGQNDCKTPQAELDKMYAGLVEFVGQDTRVEIVRDFSIRASKLFDDGYFDFVYIDADHTLEGCSADLNAWYPKVRAGGVLAGHDYFEYQFTVRFGVVEAVNRFVEEHGLELHVDEEGPPELPAHDWFVPIPVGRRE